MKQAIGNYPTKFHDEKWTDVYSGTDSHYEQWAVIMDDGDEAGHPCAFGGKAFAEKYAEILNRDRY